MANPEPARKQLSRRTNPQRTHQHAGEIKKQIKSNHGVFFNIILPVRTHANIKLYSIFNREPMGKIMSRVVEDWVWENLGDVGSAEKINPPEGDLHGKICFGIWLPKEVHVRLKLAASINKITMREVVIPVLDAWIADNCTGPDYSEKRIRALTQKP